MGAVLSSVPSRATPSLICSGETALKARRIDDPPPPPAQKSLPLTYGTPCSVATASSSPVSIDCGRSTQ